MTDSSAGCTKGTSSTTTLVTSLALFVSVAVAARWQEERQLHQKRHRSSHNNKRNEAVAAASTIADRIDCFASADDLVARYPSLANPLKKGGPILGLFFAAGWCDDCWTFTPLLEAVVSVAIAAAAAGSSKTSPKQHQQDDPTTTTTPPLIEVVYVSSDRSEKGMRDYKPGIFSEIPYANRHELAGLKRHFGACAKAELEQLGMTAEGRRHGTPTLILIETATGRVLTEDAASDVLRTANNGTEETTTAISPEQVLELWKSLLLESS